MSITRHLPERSPGGRPHEPVAAQPPGLADHLVGKPRQRGDKRGVWHARGHGQQTADSLSAVRDPEAPPNTPPPIHSALVGVSTSLMIATPILLLQLKGDRVSLLRRL